MLRPAGFGEASLLPSGPSSDTSPKTDDTVTLCSLSEYSRPRLIEALLALLVLNACVWFFLNFYRALLEGESNPEILILTERIENLPQGKYKKS